MNLPLNTDSLYTLAALLIGTTTIILLRIQNYPFSTTEILIGALITTLTILIITHKLSTLTNQP